MTRAGVPTVCFAAIAVILFVVASIGAAGGTSVGEQGLVPSSALSGVVGAFALALLIVAVIRRADR